MADKATSVVDVTATPVDESNLDGKSGGNPPDSPPGTEANDTGGSSALKNKEDNLPFDKHPKWQAARAAEKQLNEMMERNGFEDVEALMSALDKGMKLEEALSDRDIETLLERDELLSTYEKHWAEEERRKLRETETPEDTIARLEREKQEVQEKYESDRTQRQQAEDAERTVRDFNSNMEKFISKSDIPDEYQSFAKLILGIDNPILDIDISDKGAVNSTASNLIETLRSFEESVIARYKAGNKTPPPATPPAESGDQAAPAEGKKPLKNFAEMKAAMLERLKAARKE